MHVPAAARPLVEGAVIRCFPLIAATLIALVITLTSSAAKYPTPTQLRSLIYRQDPCLAHIIDHEDGRWKPTIYSGGSEFIPGPGRHVNDAVSYGLGQAYPPSKMAPFGADWETSPWTQLRWARAYAVARYGSTCAAWAYWQGHSRW